MLVPTRDFLTSALTTLGAAGAADVIDLGSCSVALVKAAIVPDVDTVWGDLTEADYDGYARKAFGTAEAPFVGEGGLTLSQGSLLEFRPTGDDTPNTIYASALVIGDVSATTLYGVEVFDSPIPLTGPGTLVTIIPRVGLDPAANWGMSLISD